MPPPSEPKTSGSASKAAPKAAAPRRKSPAVAARNPDAEAKGEAAITPPADAQPAPTLNQHDEDAKALKNRGLKDRLGQRKVYAFGVIGLTGAQLGFADWIFYEYATALNWKLPVEAIDVFLGATVVQIIGVVLAIAKGLFDDPA